MFSAWDSTISFPGISLFRHPPSHPSTGCGLEEKTTNSCQGGEIIFQNELLILQEIRNLFESILKLHSNCKTFYLNESLLRRATKTCKGTRQLDEQQMSSSITSGWKAYLPDVISVPDTGIIRSNLEHFSLIHSIFLKFRIKVNCKNYRSHLNHLDSTIKQNVLFWQKMDCK